MVVEKCREQTTVKEKTTIKEDLLRLHRLLMRISAAIEEAEGRWVANKGMIRQVSTIRDQMFRGYFLLDAFRCREKKTEDKEVRLTQSRFNPAKRLRLLTSKA